MSFSSMLSGHGDAYIDSGHVPTEINNGPEPASEPYDDTHVIDALRYAQQSAAQRAAVNEVLIACHDFLRACEHPNGRHLSVALASYRAATTPRKLLAALGVPVNPEGLR